MAIETIKNILLMVVLGIGGNLLTPAVDGPRWDRDLVDHPRKLHSLGEGALYDEVIAAMNHVVTSK